MSALTKAIKKLRPELLLCVDQEGGRVQRFQKGFTRLPPLQSIGECWDEATQGAKALELSRQHGELMAMEVRSVGVDLSFAPVLDLGKAISTVIQDRAFHPRPQIVAALATAYMQGMARWGMSATAKHFPGHGSVALDSHIGLPHDHRTMADIADDLFPFGHLIQKNLPAIMTAHIVYPTMDPAPVSFSRFWLQTVLRQKMGFQGTIISDDLSMGGAVGIGNYADRALSALHAGSDYILICNHRDGVIEAIDGLSAESVPHDALTIQRRKQLLATKPAPQWQELAQFPQWQTLSTIGVV
jgi:beta-N-acetylhexosaminidase